MSSYRQVFYQLVFSTKRRNPTIPETHCQELYNYIWGIDSKEKRKVWALIHHCLSRLWRKPFFTSTLILSQSQYTFIILSTGLHPRLLRFNPAYRQAGLSGFKKRLAHASPNPNRVEVLRSINHLFIKLNGKN